MYYVYYVGPIPRGIGTPSNIWFIGPTQVTIPNGILIGSAVFAEITNATKDTQTDTQTDHAPCIAIGRYY